MQDIRRPSQLDYLVFNSRPNLDIQNERNRFCSSNENIDNELMLPEDNCSGESLNNSDDDSPVPEPATKKGFSTVLANIFVPKNPLSDIGDLSENRLLKITNSPSVEALTELKLREKGLSQFESSNRLVLSRLLNLAILDLSKNYISNLNDIKQCTGLTYLNVSCNLIQDLTPIHSLAKLVTLKVFSNKIKDIEPLKSCEKLQKLKIHNNLVSNFESTLNTLRTLPKLNYLTIYPNPCIYKTKDARIKLYNELNLIKLDKELVEYNKINCRPGKTLKKVFEPQEVGKNSIGNGALVEQINKLKEENSELKMKLNKAYKLFEKLRIENKT